jgi:hypothetical protein
MISIARGNMSWAWHFLGAFYVFSVLFLPLLTTIFGRTFGGNWILGLSTYILSIFFHSLTINNFTVSLYSFIYKIINSWLIWPMFIFSSYILLRFWGIIAHRAVEDVFIRGKGRWICPLCGKVNRDKYDICSKCGANVEKVTKK